MRAWFSERWAAFSAATNVRRYIIGIIVATIVGAIDWIEEWTRDLIVKWLSLQPRVEGVETVLGFPSWIVGFAVLFALLFWWMLDYAVSLRRLLRPRIEPLFEPENGGISETILTNAETGEYVDDCKYVRLAVNTSSERSVNECVANIVKIERRTISGRTEVIWDQDALPLQWSMIHTYETKIHYLTKRFVDIAYIQKKVGQLQWLTIIPNRLKPRIEKEGVFLLTVVVTGDGISKKTRIEIETDGTFDGLKASPA